MADKHNGLFSSAGIAVPLKEINVSVGINGFVADLQSTSLYINKQESPIEAIFVFPVDDQSAVYKFEADIDGRRLIAECHEKGQAKEIYDDAVSHGRTAMFLEEDESAGDIFRCKLGNLPSKGEAKLSMGLVTELDMEPDGIIKFTLPTILNPRYSPDTGSLKALEGTGYVAPNAIPYKLKFQLTIRGPRKIKGVQGKLDDFIIEYLEERKVAKVTLAEEFKFEHDLCVLVEYENCNAPQIILEKGNSGSGGLLKEDVLMVNFFLKPPADIPKTSPGEFIFIIDRSGSMDGNKMQNAKEALLLFLKSLPVDCYFNVIGFGSGFESLFPESQRYNEDNVKLALEHQKTMTADLGGTEILRPLQHIYNQKLIDNYPRQLFMLTDGEVSNVAELVLLVKNNSHHTRVFTVGIGHGASTALVRGIAEAGKGKEIFVTDTERLQPKVVSLLKCSMQPVATDVELLWELPPSVTKIMMPPDLPYLYFGERQIFYLLLSVADNVDPADICGMTLKAKVLSTPFEYKETFTFHDSEETERSAPIHRLAAKAHVKLLQLSDAPPEEIILVSKAANVISKHTAFVIVDTEGQIVEDLAITKIIPQATTYINCLSMRRSSRSLDVCSDSAQSICSSSSVDKSSGPMYPNYFARPVSSACYFGPDESNSLDSYPEAKSRREMAPKSKKSISKGLTRLRIGAETQSAQFQPFENSSKSRLDSTQARSNYSILMEIIRLQNFQGFWDFNMELLDLLGAQADILKSSIPIQQDAVLGTVTAIAWLRKHHSERRDEWQMLEEKALDWLHGEDLHGHSVEELISKVAI